MEQATLSELRNVVDVLDSYTSMLLKLPLERAEFEFCVKRAVAAIVFVERMISEVK